MALVPCAICRQPFYASCHDASCIDAVCPLCDYPDAAYEAGAWGTSMALDAGAKASSVDTKITAIGRRTDDATSTG